MNTRRQSVSWAATAVVAFLACALPSTVASATLPQTTPPTTPPPAAANPSSAPVDPAANPQIVESWTLSPAVPADTPDAGNRPNLSYFLDPGAEIKDAITVYNFGNVSENFQVYATDAFNDEQGNFAALKADEQPIDVGTWVTFAQDGVTVPPGQQVTIPITLKVPVDATPGDHVGAVLASSPTIGTGDTGQVITLDRRTGTNLLVRVNGPLNPDLVLTNVDTTYHHSANSLGGSATVTFRIENRGNIRLAATPSVSVGGPFGLLASSVTMPDISELLPGESLDLTAEVPDVPALTFDKTVVELVPIGADGAATVTATDLTFAPPIGLLLVLLAALLFLMAIRARRRRRGTNDATGSASAAEPELQHS